MIVEGCDILLDVNQMFVRQGTLVQILPPGSKQGTRGTYRKLLKDNFPREIFQSSKTMKFSLILKGLKKIFH